MLNKATFMKVALLMLWAIGMSRTAPAEVISWAEENTASLPKIHSCMHARRTTCSNPLARLALHRKKAEA